ncbi:MAG: glycosyltransferase family 1 protein [Ferruginibacter sp.]
MMPATYVLDCERMKFPNTGLYHYCLQLGLALKRNLQEPAERLSLYVRPPVTPEFSQGYDIIERHPLHKFYMPVPAGKSVWHCTYQGSNYFPFRKKLPVVLTIHDLNFLYENKTPEKQQKYLGKLEKKIRHADHVVAISNFVLEDVKKHFDMNSKACSVIYNGCNISTGILPRLAENKQPAQPFLFTIGTVTDKKNFHVLPPLLQGNDRRLIIAGIIQSEAYKEKILQAAKLYNVEDRVVFTGAIAEEEKYWYLQHCEAFLFPSIAEGFGLPVIEAMYFGKPVILSTHTSLPEIGGKEAFYFPDFEPGNMRRVLEESLKAYQAMPDHESIKKRAKSFTWDEAARAYLDIYRSLA